MKRIRINAGNVGLVFRSGDYQRVIKAGKHWLFPFENMMLYDMTQAFAAPIELNILCQDETLSEMLELIEVMDYQIAIIYKDNKFESVLSSGKYAYWKGVVKYTYKMIDMREVAIVEDLNLSVKKHRALVPYVRQCTIASYEKGILYIDNKMKSILDSGEYFYWKNAQSLEITKVDMRVRKLEILGQEILTKDKATLRINLFTQYKVIDIVKAADATHNYESQLYVLIQLTARAYIGNLTLDELLEQKTDVGDHVLKTIKTRVAEIGLLVIECGLKDVILPGDVRDIMNQVLIAQKQAQANVITRREESAATRSLLNTAKLMEDNEMLFQLKEMEYVERIADKINSISLSGGGQMAEQLKSIFSVIPRKGN